jgi:hypothetical protein
MQIHNYHPTTGELMSASEADESPLEPGEFLIPAHATPIAPPAAVHGFVPVFKGDVWQTVADHRGEVWFDPEGKRITIDALGLMPEAGWSLTPPPPAEADLARAARAERTARIAGCDWTQIADAPLTAAQKTAWKAYRQALRDLTSQPGFPQQIDWPVEPGQ